MADRTRGLHPLENVWVKLPLFPELLSFMKIKIIKMLSPNSRIPSLGRPGLKHLGQGGMQRILALAAHQLILLQASDVMRTPEHLVALGEITNGYEML